MRAWLKRIAAAPGGRRGKWLVLASWLILATALGPLAGKLTEVTDSGPNAFLPRSAESAKVNTELEKFRTDNLLPAVVVYTADGPLTGAARTKAESDRAALAPLAARGERIGEPVASDDGRALLLVVPLAGDDDILDRTDEVRGIAGENVPAGVDVQVGGPAGSTTDAASAFETLDTTLMAATGLVVVILLLVIYRSPVLWLLPVLAVGFASVLTQATTYLLARHAGLPVDPQSSGVLMVLVFGVGTDYALLLIARYREELHRTEDRHRAMRTAVARSGPAILASAGTIAAGLVCLALADISSSRSMGLVGAIGVVCGFLAMITVLPALLVVTGRWVFWPLVPRHGTPAHKSRTVFERVGAAVARRPRTSWLASLGVTAVLGLSALGLDMGLSQAEMFQDKPESVVAQERISAHYPSGSADPATIVAPTSRAAEVTRAAEAVEGVEQVTSRARTPDGTLTELSVVLSDAPDSAGAEATVERLRAATDALVGGTTAQTLDTERASESDLYVVIPAVLVVVLLVLVWLLRSLVAPLLLLGTVVVSYLAALGACALLFEHVFDHGGVDWTVPLLGFVYLVALGIDYNIFLMHRAKEEVGRLGHSRGVLTALTSTGGVITGAGVVLAATFAVIAALPLVPMAQMGVLVGIGVLLDTFLVRTVLVPALALDLGGRFWWPRDPARRAAAAPSPLPPTERPLQSAR